jgi:hypothetical protein
MIYKVKWRADGKEPLVPESCDSLEAAKKRARELRAQYGSSVVMDIWNEDETWQIITPAGIDEWCEED